MSKDHGPRILNSIYLFNRDTKGNNEMYNILIENKGKPITLSIACRWRDFINSG